MARTLILTAGVKRERANALSKQRMKDRAMMQMVEMAAHVANDVMFMLGWSDEAQGKWKDLYEERRVELQEEVVSLMGEMLREDYLPQVNREKMICAVICGLMEKKTL